VSGLSFATTAVPTSLAGVYAIDVSGGTAKNYTLQYRSGALTVVAPAVVVDRDPAPVTLVRSTPALDSGLAVVELAGRPALISVVPLGSSSYGSSSKPSLEQVLATSLTAASPASFGASIPVAPAVPANAASSVLPGGGQGVSYAHENSVSAGSFNIIYRETPNIPAAFGANPVMSTSFNVFTPADQVRQAVVPVASGVSALSLPTSEPADRRSPSL
jgi:hypothetical protein